MTFEQAMKLSTLGIAVRGASGVILNYTFDWQDRQFAPGAREGEETWLRREHGAKPMPTVYAGIYADWRPWKGKDPITALGDIVRLVQCVVGRTPA